jgi:hypothetical protein
MKLPPNRVGAAGLACVVLAACGTQAGSPSTGSAAPTVSSSSAASAAVPRCNLPVTVTADSGANAVGGFLAIPSGKFTQDPSANGATYDWTFHRWLPVSPAQVSPDGSAYAYTLGTQTSPRNEIHVVNLASGADRLINNQSAYEVLAYQREGIYLDYHVSGTDGSSGLWLLDPVSGSLQAFPAGRQATWAWIAAGGAWSYSLDGSQFGSNRFARLDLATGTITTWFTVDSLASPGEPGAKSIRVFAFDGSYPLVQVYTNETTSEIWRLTAPGQGTRLPDLPFGVFSPPSTVTDSHGTWLVTPDGGVYLYSAGAFARVASAAQPGIRWFKVAGSCGG